jgi:predicted DNA binding CopG/RHH family protein
MKKQKTKDPYMLDEYEQEIEDNMSLAESLDAADEKIFMAQLVDIGKAHNDARTKINLSLRTSDVKAIQHRANKLGIDYQTYLYMLVHKHATTPQEAIQI